jgi:hypothetical protein
MIGFALSFWPLSPADALASVIVGDAVAADATSPVTLDTGSLDGGWTSVETQPSGGVLAISGGDLTFDPDGDFDGVASSGSTTTSAVAVHSNGSTYNVRVTVSGIDAPVLTEATVQAALATADDLAAYSEDVSGGLAGGAGTIVWGATGLPSGAAINSSTGVVTWSAPVAGAYDITITATDARDESDSVGVKLSITSTQTESANFALGDGNATNPSIVSGTGWTNTNTVATTTQETPLVGCTPVLITTDAGNGVGRLERWRSDQVAAAQGDRFYCSVVFDPATTGLDRVALFPETISANGVLRVLIKQNIASGTPTFTITLDIGDGDTRMDCIAAGLERISTNVARMWAIVEVIGASDDEFGIGAGTNTDGSSIRIYRNDYHRLTVPTFALVDETATTPGQIRLQPEASWPGWGIDAAQVQYRLDGGTPVNVDSADAFDVDLDGVNTFEVRVVYTVADLDTDGVAVEDDATTIDTGWRAQSLSFTADEPLSPASGGDFQMQANQIGSFRIDPADNIHSIEGEAWVTYVGDDPGPRNPGTNRKILTSPERQITFGGSLSGVAEILQLYRPSLDLDPGEHEDVTVTYRTADATSTDKTYDVRVGASQQVGRNLAKDVTPSGGAYTLIDVALRDHVYELSFDVTGTAGTVTPSLGGVAGKTVSRVGVTALDYIRAPANTTALSFAFTGDAGVSNVRCRRVITSDGDAAGIRRIEAALVDGDLRFWIKPEPASRPEDATPALGTWTKYGGTAASPLVINPTDDASEFDDANNGRWQQTAGANDVNHNWFFEWFEVTGPGQMVRKNGYNQVLLRDGKVFGPGDNANDEATSVLTVWNDGKAGGTAARVYDCEFSGGGDLLDNSEVVNMDVNSTGSDAGWDDINEQHCAMINCDSYGWPDCSVDAKSNFHAMACTFGRVGVDDDRHLRAWRSPHVVSRFNFPTNGVNNDEDKTPNHVLNLSNQLGMIGLHMTSYIDGAPVYDTADIAVSASVGRFGFDGDEEQVIVWKTIPKMLDEARFRATDFDVEISADGTNWSTLTGLGLGTGDPWGVLRRTVENVSPTPTHIRARARYGAKVGAWSTLTIS